MRKLLILIIIVFFFIVSSAEADWIAQPEPGRQAVALFDQPNSKRLAWLSTITASGKQRRLLVLGNPNQSWIKVRAPRRPNRKAFWVRKDYFQLQNNPFSLLVDRSARTLRLRKRGQTIWQTAIIVGSPGTPTPVGRFALDDFYRARDDLRPWVFRTTAHSPTLRSWQGGPARIALHGRHGSLRAPWGSAVSNGCLRTPNWALRKIRKRIPLGSEIRIRR